MTNFETYLDFNGYAIFVLSHEAIIVQANATAESELERGSMFSTDRGRKLRLSQIAETKRLHDLVSEIAVRHDTPPRAILSMPHVNPSGRRFLVLRRLLTSNGAGVADMTAERVVVSVRNPSAPLHLTEDEIVSALDLTPTEAMIALALANGRRLRQIADAAGSKITTVRWHLASAQRKTGTHSQTELVKLLLSLAH
jgi:DNA-binding CsgD family transcriptional regulator